VSSQEQSQTDHKIKSAFDHYETEGFYDEMFVEDHTARDYCRPLIDRLKELEHVDIVRRQKAADRSMLRMGITFNVYGAEEGAERIIPFDILPRMITNQEWKILDQGLKQRITALNLFWMTSITIKKSSKTKRFPSMSSCRQNLIDLNVKDSNPQKGFGVISRERTWFARMMAKCMF
jgi:hypothetical protein